MSTRIFPGGGPQRQPFLPSGYLLFNPAATEDLALFRAVLDGQHHLGGFRNQQVRERLHPHAPPQDRIQRRLSARVSRQFGRLRVRGLIRKIPRSHRWRVTADGHAFLSMALKHHEEIYVQTLVQLAA